MRSRAANKNRGQGGSELAGGVKSRWRSHIPAAGLGVKSGACRALGRGRRARGVHWSRGRANAGVCVGDGVAGRPVHGGANLRRGKGVAEQGGRAKLGLEAAAGWEEGAEGCGRFKEGGPMISEVGYGRASPEITAVISAWPVSARGKRGR